MNTKRKAGKAGFSNQWMMTRSRWKTKQLIPNAARDAVQATLSTA
ncbi:hypothetical protein [Herbaspirillum sp. CAH-3]|nr:hypothetical protein [Herbaspirillum sp. CAH-3]